MSILLPRMRTRTTTPSFLLAAILLLLLPSNASTNVTTEILSVQVLSDALEPIPRSVVRVTGASQGFVATTDAEGQLPWREIDSSPGVEIVLAEGSRLGGIAIGMLEYVPLPFQPNPGDDALMVTISRTQPVATPFAVVANPNPSKTEVISPDGTAYPHWRVIVPPATGIRFAAHIAPLLDFEDVIRFTDYRGMTLGGQLDYVRGVDLIIPGVQLGATGIIVALDSLGDLSSGNIVVDAYNIVAPIAASPTGLPLDATVVAENAGVVYVKITGGLAAGHLALLMRSTAGGPKIVSRVVDDPPMIIVPPDSGSGVDTVMLECDQSGDGELGLPSSVMPRAAVFVSDCTVPVPEQPSDWSCNPTAPSGGTCGAASAAGPASCTVVASHSPRICRAAGATFAVQQARTAKWKVKIALSSGGDGAPLTSSSGFEYGRESTTVTTDSWTAGPGADGLGQCMRYFRFNLVCAQLFTRETAVISVDVDGMLFFDPCGKTETIPASCTDLAISQGVCDRTP